MFNMRDRAEMPCDYDGPPIAEIFLYSIWVHLFCAKQKQCSDVHNDVSIQVVQTSYHNYYRKQLYTVVIFTLGNNLLYCLLKNVIM